MQGYAHQTVAMLPAKHGYRPSVLSELPDLVLAVAELLPESGTRNRSELDVVLDIAPAVEAALTALGTNPRSDAACLLIGLHPDTRGRLRKYRREAAARAMDLVTESFTKHHEPGIIDDLAVEIYRLTRVSEHDVAL